MKDITSSDISGLAWQIVEHFIGYRMPPEGEPMTDEEEAEWLREEDIVMRLIKERTGLDGKDIHARYSITKEERI